MANQAVRLWEAVLQGLTDAACGHLPAGNVQQLVIRLSDMPAQPKATWKRLVLDMQVPRKLGLFASSQLMPHPFDDLTFRAVTVTYAEAVSVLTKSAASDATPQVRSAILQQMTESGLVTCLDQLAEATAVHLEHCDVAAASGMLVWYREIAAALLQTQDCVERLNIAVYAAGSDYTAVFSTAAATHLAVAAMQSLSACLELLPPEEDPSQAVCHLAKNLATGGMICLMRVVTVNHFASRSKTPAEAQQATGRSFVAWADIALLLSTYACALKQHGHLPAVDTTARASSSSSSSGSGSGSNAHSSGGSGRGSAGAAGAASNSSSGGGGGGSSQQHKKGKKKSQAAAPVATAAGGAGTSSSSRSSTPGPHQRLGLQDPSIWRKALAEAEQLPASHKQLLGLFGVSPQAAVWVALLMKGSEKDVPTFRMCWSWNPHLSAARLQWNSTAGGRGRAEALRQQLQQWSDTPLLELLLPVLLYGAAYAATDEADSTWTEGCQQVAASATVLLRQRCQAGGQVTAGNSSSSSSSSSSTGDVAAPPLPDTVRDEMLLLTLNLLQRVQQLRTASAGGSSSSAAAAAAAAAAQAEGVFTQLLVGICEDVQSAARQVYMQQGRSAVGAGGQQGSPTSEGAAARTADTAVGLWQQQAGAICAVLEGCVRSSSLSPEVQRAAWGIIRLCDVREPVFLVGGEQAAPGLLLALAQTGSSEQQLAFFKLLVSLLKLQPAAPFPGGRPSITLVFTAAVASAGIRMLAVLAAAGDGGGDTVSLWLLLLGRCLLVAAAALEQLERQGGGREQSTQQGGVVDAGGGNSLAAAAAVADAATWVSLGWARLVNTSIPAVLRFVGQGSSLGAGLSAAGYDLGPIVQGSVSLAACCTELEELQAVPDDVGAERVDGLLHAFVSLGNALSMFAVPHCCNNPGCSNTAGLSEASIVSGKGCICAGCKVARYCGKACQAAHWKPAHKPVCRMLRARSAEQS